jgi:hypothetical protein
MSDSRTSSNSTAKKQNAISILSFEILSALREMIKQSPKNFWG